MTSAVVVVETSGSYPTLRLIGDVDLHVAPVLREKLLQLLDAGAPSKVVVDMTDVTFFDASSLGVLLAARQRANVADIDLVVRASAPVLRVVQLSGIEALFTFE